MLTYVQQLVVNIDSLEGRVQRVVGDCLLKTLTSERKNKILEGF